MTTSSSKGRDGQAWRRARVMSWSVAWGRVTLGERVPACKDERVVVA